MVRATAVRGPRRSPPSSDEVGLVDDAARLAAADADEDAFVQPVERGRGRLDPGRGAEGVFACVDVLTARETCEYFGATVTDAACLDVEQIAVVGLERVADVAEGGAVGEDGLPVGARAREQLPVQLRPGEGPPGQRHDPPAPFRDLTELQSFADGGFEAVDPTQGRIGKRGAHREAVAGSFGCASSGVTVTRSQSARGRPASRSSSCAWLKARYSPIAVVPSPRSGRLQSRTRCPSSASLAAAADSARWCCSTSASGVPAGTSTSNSTRNSMLSSLLRDGAEWRPDPASGDRGRDADVLYAARLTALAMTASRMTLATMSGCDLMRKWEAPSTSVTVEPARS